MRKIAAIGFCLMATLLMTGCFGGMEVNDRAFVQLMGLEYQDDVYIVSLQIYKSESGSSEADVSKANSIAVSGEGATVSSALADAELKTGRKLFLGHIKALIIGSGIRNPSDELALFTDGRISPSCPVVYSDDPASVTETLLEEGSFSAEQFLNIMHAYASQGKTVYTSLADVASQTGVMDCGAALPWVFADKNERSLRFDGLVFADRNGTFGYLSDEDVFGVKLLENKFESGDEITVPIAVNGRKASAVITGAKTCLKTEFSDGQLRITADINIKMRTAENPYGIIDETVEKAVRESVRDSCTSAFSTAVWYNSCDIFGIKKLVRRDCPDLYGEYCSDSRRYLSESILTVRVTFSDKNRGSENRG